MQSAVFELTLASMLLPARMTPSEPMSDDDLQLFCSRNKNVRIEREPDGELSIMTPVGFRTTSINQRITRALGHWADEDGRGTATGPDGGYILPDGSMRSPDAAWISLAKSAQFTAAEQEKFLPACPEFIIELRSPGERTGSVHEKMDQWIANGTEVAWLIDPASQSVTIFSPGQHPEILNDPSSIQGSGPVRGFELVMRSVWDNTRFDPEARSSASIKPRSRRQATLNANKLRAVESALRKHLADAKSCGPKNPKVEDVPRFTITYGALAAGAGVGIARSMPPYLNAIADECAHRKQPSLDCLVVTARFGRPGGTKWQGKDWEQEVLKCVAAD